MAFVKFLQPRPAGYDQVRRRYLFVPGGRLADGGRLSGEPRRYPGLRRKTDNNLILTFDNRVVTPVGHPAAHNCGPVHICTLEPDTHISAVGINGSLVGPCNTVTDTEGTVEIDFMVTDPGRHLAYYSLNATYRLTDS